MITKEFHNVALWMPIFFSDKLEMLKIRDSAGTKNHGVPKKNQDPFRTSETKFKVSCENFEGPIIMQNSE